MEDMTLQEIKTRIAEVPYEVGSMSLWLLVAILEELQRLDGQALLERIITERVDRLFAASATQALEEVASE